MTYILASTIALVPGLGIVGAMKAVLVLTFVLAALGTLFLARRHFGSAGAVAASAAYVFSPYVLFIDPYMRGDAAEFLALGILPWVFLAFDRPAASTRDVGWAGLALAALVLSHNLVALIGAALLAAWLMWRGLLVDGAGRWPRDLAAIVIAAGLTAVFWLPFLAEREVVHLDVAGPGHFDFRNHFVEIGTLLRPSPVLDLGATTPHFIYNFGLAQWLLALPALLALRRPSRPASRVVAFFMLISVVMSFLITPASEALWDAAPPAALIQFPWRFLGPVALALAMCVAAGVSLLPRSRFVAAAALAVVWLMALPTTYPPPWDAEFGDTSPRGMIDFEMSGVALGTTSTGDFLPQSVTQLPPPARPLLDAYAAGQAVDRFDHASSRGARVEPVRLAPLDAEYTVETATGFTARFFVFAFPGWQAYVDDRPVPIQASDGAGFIVFDVPASARRFGIHLESTPPRTLGTIVSLISGLTLVALVAKSPAPNAASRFTLHVLRVTRRSNSNSNSNASSLLPPLLIAFLVLKVGVFDRCDTCFRYTSPPGQALAATNPQRANFGDHIALLGFDVPDREVESGQTIPLTLYWKATAPVPTNYQVFAHLARPPFILWGQSDKLNPGDFPSTRWPLDKYVWDDHVIRVLPGTPPGEYAIVVGLYTLGDGRRPPVSDEAGNFVGDSVQLSRSVRVARPSVPPAVDSLGLQTRLDLRVGDLTLLGGSLEQRALSRPNFARLILFWQAASDAPANVTVHARLIDGNGDVANEIISSPTGGAYPTSSWRAGEIVRDVYAFWLPPGFPTGRYDLQLALQDEMGEISSNIHIGQLEVSAP